MANSLQKSDAMEDRQSRWGVGPKVLLTALSNAIIAGSVTASWPEVFLIHGIPYALFVAMGLPRFRAPG